MHARTSGTVNVLTHCNAGWIATVDFGTALSAIYQAHDAGIPVHVWVDETRPRSQGLLTAWELAAHGVPHTLIVDNAGGHLMQHGQVDLVLVGADRVSANGRRREQDRHLPEGTGRARQRHTLLRCRSVADDRLEHRRRPCADPDRGAQRRRGARSGRPGDGNVRTTVRVAGAATPVSNPAFDVTPARLVTGIVTERGVVAPGELGSLFPEQRRAA